MNHYWEAIRKVKDRQAIMKAAYFMFGASATLRQPYDILEEDDSVVLEVDTDISRTSFRIARQDFYRKMREDGNERVCQNLAVIRGQRIVNPSEETVSQSQTEPK